MLFVQTHLYFHKKHFEKDYVLLVKTNDKTLFESYKNHNDGFVFVADENISTRQAVLAGDIIIGDFSPEILEATLSQKPIILTGVYTSDKCEVLPEEIIFKTGLCVDNDTNDIVEKIKNADDFDKNSYDEFINEYLNGANKNRTKNVFEFLKEV